jgi:hypothetical protein
MQTECDADPGLGSVFNPLKGVHLVQSLYLVLDEFNGLNYVGNARVDSGKDDLLGFLQSRGSSGHNVRDAADARHLDH